MSRARLIAMVSTAALLAAVAACGQSDVKSDMPPLPASATAPITYEPDIHSWAQPAIARVKHVALDLVADFATKTLSGHETIWTFGILQCCTMFCFGLLAGNFGSMAMEPMGHIAGTASSAQGFISTIIGSLIGFAIGQSFNGTVVPMTLGITLCGITALGFVLLAERGKLFVARNPVPVAAE